MRLPEVHESQYHPSRTFHLESIWAGLRLTPLKYKWLLLIFLRMTFGATQVFVPHVIQNNRLFPITCFFPVLVAYPHYSGPDVRAFYENYSVNIVKYRVCG